ncbi:hypothetical protein [Rhodococcus sp. 5G237]
MSIDFTWDLAEWTEADSDALDAAILAERERNEPPKQKLGGRPTHCETCGITLRTRHAPETPGTAIHQARGMCRTCYSKAQWNGRLL